MCTLSRRSMLKQLAYFVPTGFTVGCNLESEGRLQNVCPPPAPTQVAHPDERLAAREQLARAAAWLWNQQGADGGWHSQQYALLESGQAYTPFVLHALLAVPMSICEPPEEGVEPALQFLRKHTNQQGTLGLANPDILEYPNYATSYALRCFLQVGTGEDHSRIQRMRDYLLNQQYRSENGFGPEHLAHGGWGFGGVLKKGQPGHMDLAHTRRVLEALRALGPLDADVSQRAKVFLALVQRDPQDRREQPTLQQEVYLKWLATERLSQRRTSPIPFDGGFYFSPIVLAANKGRESLSPRGSYFCSYASATCDGILSLLAAGVDPEEWRIRSAVTWLSDNPQMHYPAGIPQEHPEPWGEAIHFYHLSVRAEVGARLELPGRWRADILHELAIRQANDGSYQNKMSGLMKEDDSLLATALAVQALTHVISPNTLAPRGA